jgi:DivIVA domain-containing protein
MALTPEDIESQTFKIARRGYDKVEVDRFLGYVAASYRDVLARAETTPKPYEPATLLTPAAPLPQREPGATGAGPETAVEPEPEPEAAAPPPAEAEATDEKATTGDDFGRLGTEVAAVLRTAHHSVATLRQEAEAEATVIRQQADAEVAVLRHDAEQYAAQVRAEADVYATERKREADVERREAERALAEARVRAEAEIADAEQRIANITERAEAVARARSAEVVADANRRLEQANATEQALKERLIAAHGDLQAAIGRLPDEPGPRLVLTDADVAVVDLTDADEPGAEARVLADGTDEAEAEADAEFAPMGEPGGWDQPTGGAEPEPEPGGEEEGGPDRDPLADMVKDAVGKAVQSAMNRRPSS